MAAVSGLFGPPPPTRSGHATLQSTGLCCEPLRGALPRSRATPPGRSWTREGWCESWRRTRTELV